jgi:CRP/FNR family transcriptional regulator
VFHRKKALWEEGAESLGLYILRSGSAKSYTLNREGDAHITKFHFAGELLGLDGFNCTYHYTVELLETSSVIFISAAEVDELLSHSVHFRNTLLKSMSNELVLHSAMSLCYSDYTSEQRVAKFLVDLSAKVSHKGQSTVEFTLSMTRTEIANYLGMALETVSRVLGKFKATDVIDVNQRIVKINDMTALEKCSNDNPYSNMSNLQSNKCNFCKV